MAKIIEAKAIISAEDKTGGVFDKIAKKIEGIAKSARSSVEVDRLSKALASAQKQMAAIDRFGAARGGFAEARLRFREAELAVTKAAQAMKRGEGDARHLARSYALAQKSVVSASAAFERQKSAVLSAKRALDEMGIPATKAAQAQDRLRTSIERANAALERQGGNQQRASGRLSRAASAVGRGIGTIAPFAGPALLHGTYDAAKAGAEIQSEIVKMRAAGIPEADIQRALGESAELSAQYTNVKRSTSLERYKELRSVLLNPEEAHTLLPTTIQANAAMNAIDTSGQLSEGLGFAVKGAEVLGLTQDEARFKAYMDSFIRAQQVMGKTITPEQQYEFAKYTKASGSTLSDRFKMTTGVSLAQEMGGSTTGQSVDMFVKQLTGGFQGNLHSAAKEFVAMGLANKADFDTSKTGQILGMKPGRRVAGAALAQTDPDRYVYDYLLPALQRHGITDQNEQIAEVRRMFPAGRAADLVSKLITQRQSFENHAKLYGEAQGLNAVGNNQADPFVALNSLKTSLENFTGTLTSPAMQGAAGVLSSMASSLGSWGNALADWQKQNPELAKVAGGGALALGAGAGVAGTYSLLSGLMNGFGLQASATALDGSAAALMEAAAALSGGKLASAAASAAGASSPIWSKIPWLGAAAGVGVAGYALWDMTHQPGYHGLDINSDRLRSQRGGSVRDTMRRAFNDDRRRLGIPEIGRDWVDVPEVTPTLLQGTGISAPANVNVTGQVTGDGKLSLDINAGSSLIDVVRRAEAAIRLSGSVQSNGPGSLGLSSPDAAAPVPRPSTGGASGSW